RMKRDVNQPAPVLLKPQAVLRIKTSRPNKQPRDIGRMVKVSMSGGYLPVSRFDPRVELIRDSSINNRDRRICNVRIRFGNTRWRDRDDSRFALDPLRNG
ncbi:hypothetical protein, partial [Staphylococcus aureus]|uniref:hypothetical protein n=1 Tax=Staphylococcus aureus TaxID=1280 RepID=UPI0039BEA553